MRLNRSIGWLVTASLAVLLASCLEQYDPSRYTAKSAAEWKQSVKPEQKLTETGEVPATGGAKVVNPEERYATICANCHGAKGYGDGAGGLALNPKPRNLHDKEWHAKVDDAHIVKVITYGGQSVGLSGSMAAWGSILSQEEVLALVQMIRKWGQE